MCLGQGMSRAGSASCPTLVSAAQPQPCSCLSPELPALVRMEPTKIPLTKRVAPAPPVPAKTKPAPVLATKPSDPQPSASADVEQGRAGDPDAHGFNMVSVTTARLSHPTATRPRIPGQRPPSIALGSTGGPLGEEQPQGLPRAALCAPVPSTGQAPVPPWSTEGLEVEGRSLALEDLKAEVRTLHILVDLMRVQHLRDLQDLRQELCQERTQRQALQVEIERMRKGLPC
ncbi:SH3 domain-containing kinase-binding protein 1-like [Cinclus cinclus]|uniref:SH3 domain-containing kinase-binding protein 1-like n=1 Tax=Cinclus cinclus TaxID=127875 RepID=UPI002E0F451A